MPQARNSAKTERAYHHGNLRAALLDAALAVLTENGVTGFSLRETARRASVTPSAPKHHFSDARGLLTALATEAFRDLACRLETADQNGTSRSDSIVAQGQAYLDFALDQRALFELMWQGALLDLEDADLLAEKARAFAVLERRVRGAGAEAIALDDPGMATTFAFWSVVHGFAHMVIEGNFGMDTAAAGVTARTLLPLSLGLLMDESFG
jgi:AcrR family transcriptional regulator